MVDGDVDRRDDYPGPPGPGTVTFGFDNQKSSVTITLANASTRFDC